MRSTDATRVAYAVVTSAVSDEPCDRCPDQQSQGESLCAYCGRECSKHRPISTPLAGVVAR